MKGHITVITGAQFGDEAKGKIVDWYGRYRKEPSLFARWQGGNNAGHTITVNGDVYKLHYIPGGVVTAKDVLLGHDMVIHPRALIEKEILPLKQRTKWDPETQLFISDRAHVTFDQHIIEDGIMRIKQGKFSADSTLRGISPTYADKALRFGIRFGDLLNRSRLKERLKILLNNKKPLFESCAKSDFEEVKKVMRERYGDFGLKIFEAGTNLDPEIVANQYHELGVQLEKQICDTTLKIHKTYDEGNVIIAEGAQGTALDLNYGAYPFTTSSHPIVGAACTGLGVSPKMINHSIGVVKIFSSRVGGGPLVTELHKDPELVMSKEQQDALAKVGNEWGTTTGRVRRLLWLDGVQLKHAARVNGFDEIALTKIDTMPLLNKYIDQLKIATAYVDPQRNKITEAPPTDWAGADSLTAEYLKFPAWAHRSKEEWASIMKTNIPAEIQNYARKVGEIMNTKNLILSFGPERDATVEFKL